MYKTTMSEPRERLMANELKKILYVEDEPDIQAVARVALESVGGFELLV